jgi:trans-2,3-dihydro-3-hydroxyanthranilate isomerase
MTTLTYHIVNVFTQGDDPFSGNPLCVFESGESLDAARMQALALQFNLSETTFVFPSQRASARVRIFTPHYEMRFAGHPTLGTAHVCRALGWAGDSLTLEMPAGIIPVQAAGRRWTLQANPPTWREVPEPRATLASMLGIDEREIGERPLWVNAGTEQLVIPITHEAAIRRAKPVADILSSLSRDGGERMAYLFAPLKTPGRLLARFFFPQGGGVIEDPATGSATANLGGWYLAMGRSLPQEQEISQGEYAGRPSTLFLQVGADRSIGVSGEVIVLGKGTITL